MALVHEIPIHDREAMLRGFAESYGRYPPRDPKPAWWAAFEAFYQSQQQPEVPDGRLLVRTETFPYGDDPDDVAAAEAPVGWDD